MKNIVFILAVIVSTVAAVHFAMTVAAVFARARTGKPFSFSYSLWPPIISALLWAVWSLI